MLQIIQENEIDKLDFLDENTRNLITQLISEDELDFEKYFSTPIDQGANVYVYDLQENYIIKAGKESLIENRLFIQNNNYQLDIFLDTYAIKLNKYRAIKQVPKKFDFTNYIFIQPKANTSPVDFYIDFNVNNLVEYNRKLVLCDW